MFLLVGKLMRKIFFGTLRAAELEHLIERAWYAVTETCLAFTVFRDDLNARFVGIFALLLFLKCFHWLAEDRVDFMERSPNINILFHVRIVSLLTVLASCDVTFIYFAYNSIITKGAGTQLVFGFEYAILLATILNIVMKYILHWIDIASDSPWDEKAVWLLYTELLMSILKVTLYLIFVAAMLKYHNFPLFALRPIYLSLRTLKKALCDVIMSRRAIRNMNTLYPNATHDELANSDNVCIICREEMTGNGSAKKLPCNHIFHVSCLRSWFQRQQTCPTCRMDILRWPHSTSNPANVANNNANNNNMNNLNVNNNNMNNNNNNNVINANNNDQNLPNAPNVNDNNNNGNNSGGANSVQINNNNQTRPGNQAGSTGGTNTRQAGTSQNQVNVSNPTHLQVILQDQMAAVMIHTFAQMFVEAMLTHLQALNLNQQQQRQTSSSQQPISSSTIPTTSTQSQAATTLASSATESTSTNQPQQTSPTSPETTDQHQQTEPAMLACSSRNASTQTDDPPQ